MEIYERRVLETLENTLSSPGQTLVPNTIKDAFAALVRLVHTFGTTLFEERHFASRTDAIFIAHPVTLLHVSTEGVTTYLRHRSVSSDRSGGQLQAQAFWTVLLGALASSPKRRPLFRC